MRSRKPRLSTLLLLKALTTEYAHHVVVRVSTEGRLYFWIMYLKCFIFKARKDKWESYIHFQYEGGVICGDMLISKVRKDAYSYAEFTKTKWQNSSLYNLSNSSLTEVETYSASQYWCVFLRFICRARVFVHTQTYECVFAIFVWCRTAGSDCPVFPFPLWLITRVPVNPWYHHRIKRRPPSPREPISSERRTQTGKLLDIFAGPGMVKTSGLKDAPWHHPAVGRSAPPIRQIRVHKQKCSIRLTWNTSAASEEGYSAQGRKNASHTVVDQRGWEGKVQR